MKKKHKLLFAIAFALAIASWLIAIYYWGKLPSSIPTHFGFSGQADAWSDKTIISVFLMPLIQSLILGLFVFLYYKPQYSDIPTTMWLTTLDKKHKEHAFKLIRIMMVGMSIWIGVLFTYITYAMNASAVDKSNSLSSGLIFAIIGLMILWLTYWTVKVYKATKEVIASAKK